MNWEIKFISAFLSLKFVRGNQEDEKLPIPSLIVIYGRKIILHFLVGK
jgi:hypothetical protein